MRISLIDVDSKIPNLALMKISAYHKNKGDTVGFNLSNPDKIYSSIIFKKNNGKSMNQQIQPIPIEYGGTGYDLSIKLPDYIEFIKPDYNLYPSTYSQGFTTRGCTRNCYFCVVPKKEGKLRRSQHPKEFYDDRFNTIMIMDNNWLADREWFFKTSQWILDQKLKVIEHGLDIRLLDKESIQRLQDLKIKLWHFAFDFIEYTPVVKDKIKLLKKCGVNTKNKVCIYCYIHDDLHFDNALARCNILRDLGVNARPMWNCDSQKTQRVRSLLKWAWRPCLYWKFPFNEYSKLKHT
jgi:hypothetical protein